MNKVPWFGLTGLFFCSLTVLMFILNLLRRPRIRELNEKAKALNRDIMHLYDAEHLDIHPIKPLSYGTGMSFIWVMITFLLLDYTDSMLALEYIHVHLLKLLTEFTNTLAIFYMSL